jgi:multiple sugar transport system permease protein
MASRMTTVVTAKQLAPQRREQSTLKRFGFEYLLLLPALALAGAVVFYPILYAIDISVHETEFLKKTRFIGLGHYVEFFSQAQSWRNVANSLVLVFGSLALTMPIGLGLALLLNRHFRLRTLFRTLLVFPWVISQVIAAMLWSWLLNAQFGTIRLLAELFGLGQVDVVGSPSTAMIAVIWVNVWRTFPFAMLLILAALQTVPSELLEAARMDGAGAWRRFKEVTLPLIRNTLMVVAIMLSLSYFNSIDIPFVLTGGGPLGRTEILSLRVYNEAFTNNKLGFGSAIAMLVFAVNMILSLVYIRLLRTERHV